MKINKYLIIVIFLSVAAYSNTLFNGFIWDDNGLVKNDKFVAEAGITDPFTPSYYRDIPAEERGRLRPLRLFTFVVDRMLYGDSAWGYHLTNMLLHTVNVILMYLVAARLFSDKRSALLAAALFAVHPVHVDSIAWIKNRSDVLCGAFFLLALLAFFKMDGVKRIAAAALCFAGAFLSKETAIVMPVILALAAFVFLPEKTARKALLWTSVFMVFAAAVYFAKEMLWKKEITAQTNILLDANVQVRIILYTLSAYFSALIFPVVYSVERDIMLNLTALESVNWAFIIFIVIGLWLSVGYLRDRYALKKSDSDFRNAFFGYWFMMILVLPVSNVIFLESRPIAEQRLYIPSMGLCFMAGDALSSLIGSFKGSVSTAVSAGAWVLIAAFALVTVSRTYAWRDEFTFWTAAVKANPTHYRANFNLGAEYQKTGDFENAVKHYEISSRDCDLPEVYYGLGYGYDRLGDYGKSLKNYERALKLSDSPKADLYNNMGIVCEKMKNKRTAGEYYRKALEVSPEYEPARKNLEQLWK
ncbi:MAG: tetratricopeptide repeat protein [Elusimicrobiota bacterium]